MDILGLVRISDLVAKIVDVTSENIEQSLPKDKTYVAANSLGTEHPGSQPQGPYSTTAEWSTPTGPADRRNKNTSGITSRHISISSLKSSM